MWRDTQQAFAAALRDPGLPVPSAIARTNNAPSQKRFGVYRNNVAVGLVDAIADTYPVVQELVGEEFFRAMARMYSRLFLPSTPVLLNYGEDFPDFLGTLNDAASLPYLADVARLEWAWNRAFHAADQTPLGIDALAAIPEQALEDIRLRFHPSVRLLGSPWPVVSIWQAHQLKDPQASLGQLPDHGEQAIILRPDMAVYVHALTPEAHDFTGSLFTGQALGQASALVAGRGRLELSGHLSALFETGAIVGII